jgi:hypothetical protein
MNKASGYEQFGAVCIVVGVAVSLAACYALLGLAGLALAIGVTLCGLGLMAFAP